MAKTKTQPTSRIRKVKLSDGTVIKVPDNSKGHAKKVGKHVPNKEQPDPEEKPAPKDSAASLQYPPPRNDPVFRQKWAQLIENVSSRENFKLNHLDLLEILCDLYSELEVLNKYLRMNGMSHDVIMVTGKKRAMYPEVAQRDKVRGQIHQYSRYLDLFPKKDKSPRGMDSKNDEKWS